MLNTDFPQKLLCCSSLLWLLMILLASALLFVSLIYNLTIKEWLYQGEDSESWEGDLFGVHSSGGLIPVNDYSSVAEGLCDLADDSDSEDQFEELCSRFTELAATSLLYLSTTVIATLLIIVVIIFAAITWLKEDLAGQMLGAAFGVFAVYFSGGVVYLIFSHSTYDEDVCDKLFVNDDMKVERVCRDLGANYAIFNIGLTTAYCLFILATYLVVRRELKRSDFVLI